MNPAPRCLPIAGGLHHPADAAAPSIVRALGQHGVETETEEDVEHAGTRLARGGYDLLAICALRWSISDARHDAQRAHWGLELSQGARDAASLDHPVHQRLPGRAACWALGCPPYGDTASAAPQPPRSAFHA